MKLNEQLCPPSVFFHPRTYFQVPTAWCTAGQIGTLPCIALIIEHEAPGVLLRFCKISELRKVQKNASLEDFLTNAATCDFSRYRSRSYSRERAVRTDTACTTPMAPAGAAPKGRAGANQQQGSWYAKSYCFDQSTTDQKPTIDSMEWKRT